MVSTSLKSVALVSLLLVSACATTSPTAAGTTASAPASNGYGFVVAPMTIVPPASGPSNGTVATALQADGSAGVGTDRFGRVERNRVVSAGGDDLLRLNADGTVTLPWSTGPDGPRFRFTAQGLEAVNRGTTTLITVDASGAFSENGTPTGARVTPYDPAHRDTALLLRMIHAIAFMHGMATSGANAVTPAP
jgi:hypothetical protein